MNVYDALERRHSSPAWALFYEVGDRTGFATRRHADAIAMGIWPSRGLSIHGYELKSRRGDWLRELKDPEKAESISPFCDFWWILACEGGGELADEKGIVRLSEVPETWGFLKFTGKKLIVIKDAPKRESKPLDRDFVAAILRRASEQVQRANKVELTQAEHYRLIEQGKNAAAAEFRDVESENKQLKQDIAEFETRSGLNIRRYTGDRLGDAVRMLLDAQQPNWEKDRLEDAASHLEALAQAARRSANLHRKAFESVKKAPPLKLEAGA